MKLNEEQAISALRRGESGALEWIIDRYAPYVSAVVYNIIGVRMTGADVEEVSSDVFLALWNNADKIMRDKLRAYLGGIARNMAKNKLRECKIELSLEEDEIEIPSTQTPESELIDGEPQRLARLAVMSMGEPDREIFLRQYYYCQTVTAIAAEMRLNVSTVKSRLSRGRQKLKQTLETGGIFDENEDLRPFRLHG
jgi:RNA polymerase sigma-70 factor (ECF subfamily)